jgi:hypothetical protein
MTQDVDNDYYAEVSTAGSTFSNEDAAKAIIDRGSEYQYETLLSIINQVDRIKREKLLAGTSVQDGIAHFTPRVAGNWIGAIARFDREYHRITLDIAPTAAMRKALSEEVDVEVLGVRDSGAYIGLVTDLSTGVADGEILLDEDFAIEGNKIKIDPIKEDALGIFLVPQEGTKPPTKITTRLIQNDPKKIIARVPATLDKGTYQLRIVTRFTGTSTPLKEPRTITYGEIITVTGSVN